MEKFIKEFFLKRKLLALILFFFLVIFLIGFIKNLFFAYQKEINIENQDEILESKEQRGQQTKDYNTQLSTNSPSLSPTELKSFLTETERLHKEIENEFIKLTKNLHPEPNKSISEYQKEIEEFVKKANIKIRSNRLTYQDLINLAENLAKINPPPILFSSHKEFIKIYLKAGLILKFAQETKDPIKQILFYNMVKETLNEIKL